MAEIGILLIAIFVALCFIARQLGKTNEILKELLASSRQRKYRELTREEPLPPPLSLTEEDRRNL
jgi:hypothetical protein